MNNLLLFGVNSSIGLAILKKANDDNILVTGVGRNPINTNIGINNYIVYNPDKEKTINNISKIGKFNKIVFSQGINFNDSVYNFDPKKTLEMFKVNCLYIPFTINKLLSFDAIGNNTRIVVISSIWQNITRQNKLSYTITKSALAGTIRQIAVDIAKQGHTINAILPGVLDTEMTKNNLSEKQISVARGSTLANKLVSLEDVAKIVLDLCNVPLSVTGQMINIDYGFSYTKIL